MRTRQRDDATPDLFDWTGTPEQERDFAQWLAENDRLWRTFVHFTFEAVAAGLDHYSADAVLHRVRWESSVREKGGDFKCNNNFTPFLAREFHRRYPQHAAFFRMRRSKADQDRAA